MKRIDAYWRRRALVAATGAGAASMLLAALASGDDTALVMGGTGVPVPPQSYLDKINDQYLDCDDCTLQGVFTPEGVYPASGVHSLTLDASVDQGVAALDDALKEQLANGNDVTVAGYSQSATIASQEMAHIVDGSAGVDPDPDQLSFALIGNPSNPNGGLLARLDFPPDSDPTIPTLGITFDGAAPETDYPTTEYTSEYDGFADFPLYPLNFLADANAVLGIIFVHTRMPDFTSEQLDDAVQVPTSDGDDGDTTYYMIPTDDLPLLDPLRSIPVAGPVLADLIQPGLRPLVNLGYGDPDYGWVNEDADVPTTLGLLPDLDDVAKVPGMVADGIGQGIHDAIGDLKNPSELFSLDDNPLLDLADYSALQQVQEETFPLPTSPSDSTSIVDAVGDAASQLYSALLPTVDIATALFGTLPAYDVDVFFDELADGDLIGALGYPLAVDNALLPLAGLFELLAVGESVTFAAADLASPFLDVSGLVDDLFS